MIVLNKDILKLILTNIGTNIISSFINLSRCTEILKVIVEILNKSEFDIEPIWGDEARHNDVLINVEKEPFKNSFNLKLPRSLSKVFASSTIKHLAKESFLLIIDNIELYKLNSKTKECTALIKENLSSYSLNRENSTISAYFHDKKANVMVLKVINFEGLVLHNIPNFQTSFNTFIYNNDIFYYLQNGN
jgi:superfamily II helicase